ncbi:hypothetical protein ROS62_03235 [Streptomyces sp. DSM 41972]|uniref:Transketolase C-terminal domain-containing protein n=1 Tax=Streptomyces althioticus subsp. attaecolombicae TaxID=3075534 RepID=A0ABU3HTB9_9ACTN|nr:hypothetical protein [Streptomyces sp. DSM 41972]SCD56659.1 transketolase [Streptomyces sp. di50b]SCE24314.1 transketolase [Streptomyces sp. di188]
MDGRRFLTVREGRAGVVVTVGPMLDAVLAATEGLDVTVLYATTVRPFGGDAPRRATVAAGTDVVLVEPYPAGTSTAAANDAPADVPHRVLGLGVDRAELRRYGRIDEHVAAHGLDARSLRGSLGSPRGPCPPVREPTAHGRGTRGRRDPPPDPAATRDRDHATGH